MQVYSQEKIHTVCSQCDQEYIKKKSHTAAHNATKGLKKKTYKSMKEYIQEKNRTDAHNVITDSAKC